MKTSIVCDRRLSQGRSSTTVDFSMPGIRGFAARLRRVIQRGGVSVESFARDIGIGKAALYTYLKASRVPSADLVAAVCERGNVSADWLLLGRQAGEGEGADGPGWGLTDDERSLLEDFRRASAAGVGGRVAKFARGVALQAEALQEQTQEGE